MNSEDEAQHAVAVSADAAVRQMNHIHAEALPDAQMFSK